MRYRCEINRGSETELKLSNVTFTDELHKTAQKARVNTVNAEFFLVMIIKWIPAVIR